MATLNIGLSSRPSQESLDLIVSVSPQIRLLDISEHLAQEAESPAAKAKADEMLAQIEVLFLGRLPPDLAKRAPKLRWVQWLGTGVDHLVRGGLFEGKHYQITNVSGTNALAIAEHAFMFILMWAKKAPGWMEQQRNADYKRDSVRPDFTEGRTLGVLGLGPIGMESARLGKAFRMRVLGIRRSAAALQRNVGDVDELWPPSRLHEMLGQCDYIVNALPLTKETEHIIGAPEFAAMKQTAFYVNVGRGKLVDEAAMVRALQEKRIAGAGLDVFETEPLAKESPLWAMLNVFITPHVSGDVIDNRDRAVRFFAENLKRYLNGQPLKNVVDVERGY